MESVVEHCHLRHIRHELVHGTDTCEVALVVYRCEVDEALDTFLNFRSDEATLLEKVTTLHDTVANGSDLVQTLDGTKIRIEEALEHELHTFLVSRQVGHDLFFSPLGSFTLMKASSMPIRSTPP